jgi:hypothetical protein
MVYNIQIYNAISVRRTVNKTPNLKLREPNKEIPNLKLQEPNKEILHLKLQYPNKSKRKANTKAQRRPALIASTAFAPTGENSLPLIICVFLRWLPLFYHRQVLTFCMLAFRLLYLTFGFLHLFFEA